MTIKLPYLMAVTIAALGVSYLTTTQGLSAAPATTITSLDSTRHELASDGSIRLITFYSPDCPFSQRDAADLNALHDQFDGQAFDVIGIAMSYDNIDSIETFEKSRQVEYDIAHDVDGSIAAAFPGVRFTPTTFLIDDSGNIVWRHTGRMSIERVSSKITSLLSNSTIAQLSR